MTVDINDAARRISSLDGPAQVLDLVESVAREFGATHIFLSGLPLPGRPLKQLILRVDWGNLQPADADDSDIQREDPILSMCLTLQSPVNWQVEGGGEATMMTSELLEAAARHGDIRMIAVPIREINPYQGCVIVAGPSLAMNEFELMVFDRLCAKAFRRLLELGRISVSRPGDLSARERRVLELTAIGKTANQIAQLLKISQRTVHAHLQNAGDKMKASNKTHTAVQALRYAQITL